MQGRLQDEWHPHPSMTWHVTSSKHVYVHGLARRIVIVPYCARSKYVLKTATSANIRLLRTRTLGLCHLFSTVNSRVGFLRSRHDPLQQRLQFKPLQAIPKHFTNAMVAKALPLYST